MRRVPKPVSLNADDGPRCASDNASKPHIITLMADDIGFSDTGFGGSSVARTPHLDALAREAVHLTHFRAPVWCAPSRAAFLSGRHGWEVGLAAAHGWTALGSDTLLLSELLREASYHTAVVGKFHFNPRLREAHPSGGSFGCGFDQQYGFVGGMTDYYDHHPSWSRDGVRLREQGYATELFAAEAARIVRQHAAERPHRPLFLWLALNAPHTPMQAPEAAVARFPASYPPETRRYLAMVESMDSAFGVALEALRDTRMLPRALVLFLADNGGPMIPPVCNGGLRGGKGTPFEGGVRAPAFVRWPSCLGHQQRRSSAPAHMVDWLATFALAAAAGDGAEARARRRQRLRRKAPHSASLWPALEGRPLTPSSPLGPRRQLVLQVAASSAGILRGKWKLVIAAPRCLATPQDTPHTEPMPVGGSGERFKADRFLLWNVHGRNCSAREPTAARHGGGGAAGAAAAPPRGRECAARQEGGRALVLHNGTNGERLRAAQRAGARLQLFDLHADPHERHDLLWSDNQRHELLISRRSNGTRRAEMAGALLGHYLAAVRVARRAVVQAREQGRLPQFWEMTVWFCRQVQGCWDEQQWARARGAMCAARAPSERRLVSLESAGGRGASRGGMRGMRVRKQPSSVSQVDK